MAEFLELQPPTEALERFLKHLHPLGDYEQIRSLEGSGRVTAGTTVAPFPLPSFPRSTVDGYALIAADTYGASDHLPAYSALVDEVPMGAIPNFSLQPKSCALIHTGGMLPEGADAVVMIEHTQESRAGEIEILRGVAVGENVIKTGEDVQQGDEVIPAGSRLRAPEIGGLMALGIESISVVREPRVGIISSGDEVVAPGTRLSPGQVYDVNSYTLSSLVRSVGGVPFSYGIVTDEQSALEKIAAQALRECDVVVLTAGSSVSARDLTATVIDRLGTPGVLVHGVNVRPGKPTILGICGGKAVIGLPGNPVSAFVIAGLFVAPVIETLLGMRRRLPHPTISARLTLNLASAAGREDWVAVRLHQGAEISDVQAEPVFGKSNLIFTLARADGLVRIPPDANGLSAGEIVTVRLL
jgi:molybdopterin molybdotransferase